jgi:hypothetical protein
LDRRRLLALGLAFLLAVAFLALMVVPAGAIIPTPRGFPLIADKDTQVGVVSVTHSAETDLAATLSPVEGRGNLLVHYELDQEHIDAGLTIEDVQVAVGDTLAELPVNKSGNPVAGLFGWKPDVPEGATDYTVIIPVSQSGLTDGTDVFFAAHADLSDGASAWAEGLPFPKARNGGMYFKVNCGNPED